MLHMFGEYSHCSLVCACCENTHLSMYSESPDLHYEIRCVVMCYIRMLIKNYLLQVMPIPISIKYDS